MFLLQVRYIIGKFHCISYRLQDDSPTNNNFSFSNPFLILLYEQQHLEPSFNELTAEYLDNTIYFMRWMYCNQPESSCVDPDTIKRHSLLVMQLDEQLVKNSPTS